MFQRMIAAVVCFFFFCSNFQYANANTFSVSQLPLPGKMVETSSPFTPAALKGIVVDPNKPLELQFIVDTGDGSRQSDLVKEEANQLVKYFLAGLTIPEGDLWVNLSPYEKDRIVPDALGQTDLGRDLLAQDYILKQLTASAIYPEKELGKEFWYKVYAKAQAQYGTTNIPVNTFNKVWIMPKEAQVFENNNAAYVTKATLKVMLDEDYLSKEKHQASKAPNVTSEIVRSIVLPEIEREVNFGKNFAPLRQIYQALILAKWYRETVKNALFEASYVNKNMINGVELSDMTLKEQIYGRYLEAYKKGVFNLIKEDSQAKPRKYFSGGLIWTMNLDRTSDSAMISRKLYSTVGGLLLLGVTLGVSPGQATTQNKTLAQSTTDIVSAYEKSNWQYAERAKLVEKMIESKDVVFLPQLIDFFKNGIGSRTFAHSFSILKKVVLALNDMGWFPKNEGEQTFFYALLGNKTEVDALAEKDSIPLYCANSELQNDDVVNMFLDLLVSMNTDGSRKQLIKFLLVPIEDSAYEGKKRSKENILKRVNLTSLMRSVPVDFLVSQFKKYNKGYLEKEYPQAIVVLAQVIRESGWLPEDYPSKAKFYTLTKDYENLRKIVQEDPKSIEGLLLEGSLPFSDKLEIVDALIAIRTKDSQVVLLKFYLSLSVSENAEAVAKRINQKNGTGLIDRIALKEIVSGLKGHKVGSVPYIPNSFGVMGERFDVKNILDLDERTVKTVLEIIMEDARTMRNYRIIDSMLYSLKGGDDGPNNARYQRLRTIIEGSQDRELFDLLYLTSLYGSDRVIYKGRPVFLKSLLNLTDEGLSYIVANNGLLSLLNGIFKRSAVEKAVRMIDKWTYEDVKRDLHLILNDSEVYGQTFAASELSGVIYYIKLAELAKRSAVVRKLILDGAYILPSRFIVRFKWSGSPSVPFMIPKVFENGIELNKGDRKMLWADDKTDKAMLSKWLARFKTPDVFSSIRATPEEVAVVKKYLADHPEIFQKVGEGIVLDPKNEKNFAILFYDLDQKEFYSINQNDIGTPKAEIAFMEAARRGSLPTVSLLIKKGINVNAQNQFGATALMLAVGRGHESVVNYLLEHNADPDLIHDRNRMKSTALIVAAENKVLAQEQGSSMEAAFDNIARNLVRHKADIETAVIYAQKYDNFEMYSYLRVLANDQAMIGQEHIKSEEKIASVDYGGIDLNQINVNREGKRVVVKFDPAMLKDLIQGDFKGFAPTITDIQPIASPLPLLGVAAGREN